MPTETTARSAAPSSTALPRRVLHVAECYEAGVGLAVDANVSALPEVEHHLLHAGSQVPRGFASATRMAPTALGRVRQVRELAAATGADVVHAHSSWAGVYARALPPPVPVVYQPHCYRFEDERLRPTARWVFRTAERLLAPRAAVTLAVSPHEAARAADVGDGPVVLVPNASGLPWRTHDGAGARARTGAPQGAATVVTVGRVAAQKDPELFADVAAQVLAAVPGARVRWVGDGDPATVEMLRAHGVEVTGWLDQHAVAAALDQATVYVHTATYEGFPIAILDAAARDLPVVAHEAPYLAGTDLPQFSDAASAVRTILALLAGGPELEEARAVSRGLRGSMNRDVQRAGLVDAYARVRAEAWRA